MDLSDKRLFYGRFIGVVIHISALFQPEQKAIAFFEQSLPVLPQID